MTTYTITISTAEELALGYVSLSQQDWIENAVHERCRIAIDEIVAITVQKCLDTNTPIPGSKDAIVELAFAQGWVLSAEERNNQLSQTTLD
jgi:hypothetical protein